MQNLVLHAENVHVLMCNPCAAFFQSAESAALDNDTAFVSNLAGRVCGAVRAAEEAVRGLFKERRIATGGERSQR